MMIGKVPPPAVLPRREAAMSAGGRVRKLRDIFVCLLKRQTTTIHNANPPTVQTAKAEASRHTGETPADTAPSLELLPSDLTESERVVRRIRNVGEWL